MAEVLPGIENDTTSNFLWSLFVHEWERIKIGEWFAPKKKKNHKSTSWLNSSSRMEIKTAHRREKHQQKRRWGKFFLLRRRRVDECVYMRRERKCEKAEGDDVECERERERKAHDHKNPLTRRYFPPLNKLSRVTLCTLALSSERTAALRIGMNNVLML